MMVRFVKDEVSSKNFFHPSRGYTQWNALNDEFAVTGLHLVRPSGAVGGDPRALVDLPGGVSCRPSQLDVARKYRALPHVRLVYLDGGTGRGCRFSYRIVLAFDRKAVTPDSVRSYGRWSTLNRIYGVVGVEYRHAEHLRAVLEFEPGLYSHDQMRAIRDEYLKLPGIKFGWVAGHPAADLSTVVLTFRDAFLRRVPLRMYTLWENLNRRHNTEVTIVEEGSSRAFLRFPKGKYTDDQLKTILRKYRQLPGVSSVRMMTHAMRPDVNADEGAGNATSSSVFLDVPQRRSFRSWLRLTGGSADAEILLDGGGHGEEEEDDDDDRGEAVVPGRHRTRHSRRHRWDYSSCAQRSTSSSSSSPSSSSSASTAGDA